MIVKLFKKSKKSKSTHKTKKEWSLIRYRNPELKKYRGRFAPSPTGPLHYGSLVTALASYLQARTVSGEWLVRIEDIDPDRQPKGATQDILQCLSDYGFEWDHDPILQSKQQNLHNHLALKLLERNLAYYCACSRKDLSNNSKDGPMGPIYPGTCSNKDIIANKHNLRVRTENTVTSFQDLNYGKQTCNLKLESGDYVIYRADHLPSYIFAVTIDDLFEGYTEVVRGSDLLDISPRQVYLTQLLNRSHSNFLHIPIITDHNGNKLSKQNGASALKKHEARSNLFFALQDLGQDPPRHLIHSSLVSVWEWALTYWDPRYIPKQKCIRYNH